MNKNINARLVIQYKLHLKYIIPILSICLWGCTKTITVKTPISASQVVIQGNVYDTAGPYYVTLARSVEYSLENDFPPVSGAQITIKDSTTGILDFLTETVPGTYATSSLMGVSGHTYLLSVKIGDSLFTASSTMPARVNLDSVTFEANSGLGKSEIHPYVNFQDPPGIANYYKFTVYVNGAQPDKKTFVYDDRLSDGRYINTGLRLDSNYIAGGDLVTVQMNCIDKNIYNFYNTLENASGNSNTIPANPDNNLTGGALGYFSAQTMQKVTAVAYK